MKQFTAVFLVSIVFSLSTHSQDTYLIQNTNVIPMHKKGVQSNMDILVVDGVFRSIGKTGSISSSDAVIIDGTNKYVVPGISEMHAHIPVPPEGGDDTYVREVLFLYLSNGITTIRGMLGNPYHLDLREAVSAGDIPGPRIYTSSPSMNGNSVQSEEEAIEKVTRYAIDGYDFLKIHPGIQGEVMQALVSTADQVGIDFAGHVPVDVGVRNAIAYKYATIDHVDGFVEGLAPADYDREAAGFFGSGLVDQVDLKELPKLCKSARKNDVWIVPTQSLFTRWISPEDPEEMMKAQEMAYMPAATRYQWASSKSSMINSDDYSEADYYKFLDLRKQIIKALYDANVGFLLGSDAPQVFNVPGFSIQHEMQSLHDAGMSNENILRSGTLNPAEFFGRSGQFGQISEGAEADIILLEANPLDDISNMQKIAGVMYRGNWLSRNQIDERLAELEANHKTD